jgi:type II secretory ATPase GspE/PulE/Tfp pilus assembly ATPase PilB-like protein
VNQFAYNTKAGLDFDHIIGALLRQDPDVILIGEIRNAATAELALQAAQTGHLVFSSLHTRGAIASVERLRSLGIANDRLRSSLRCISSQRLVRQICSACLGVPSAEGCKQCAGVGLFDRIGVHEILPFTNSIADAFERHTSISELTDCAKEVGFMNMRSAGMQHVQDQRITLSELEAQLGSWY